MSDTPRTDALADKMPTRTMDEGILLDHAHQLERENSALKSRLEMDTRHPYDGIECRDETIRQLERENAALKALLFRVRSEILHRPTCAINMIPQIDAAIDATRKEAP